MLTIHFMCILVLRILLYAQFCLFVSISFASHRFLLSLREATSMSTFFVICSIVKAPEHNQALIDQGFNPDYFGTCSLHKGAVTHVACGVTSSPRAASICIRANWVMPGVMNRYIKYEGSGDQYDVGRCASG